MPFKKRSFYEGEYEPEAFRYECTECCEYFNHTTEHERCPYCGSHHVIDSEPGIDKEQG